ncbi:MAG TPA: hypothetical protein VF796_12050 [Humisphaera sp.]
MLHLISTIVILLVAAGLYFRRDRRVHVPLMVTAFLTDLGLVLYIELSRGAVAKVATGSRWLLWVHAAISLGVLACYVAMFVLGRRVNGGAHASRRAHRNVGMTFVALRGLNYATALML